MNNANRPVSADPRGYNVYRRTFADDPHCLEIIGSASTFSDALILAGKLGGYQIQTGLDGEISIVKYTVQS